MTKKEIIRNFLDKWCDSYEKEYLLLIVLEQKLDKKNPVSDATITNAFYGLMNDDIDVWQSQISDNISYLENEYHEDEIKEAINEIESENE